MKKRDLKKLALNKRAISKINEQFVTGGDVSLPNPATAERCDLTGENFCVSWNACNTRMDNVTCLYTGGPTKPIDTTIRTIGCDITNIKC